MGVNDYSNYLCFIGLMKTKWLLGLGLVFILTGTRFGGLFWGNGFFFHPDENNMARAVATLNWPQLHPHFFAYGQFPLYLTYLAYQTYSFVLGRGVFQLVPFKAAIYLLRFWSAAFSIGTIIVGWFLAKLLFKKEKWAKIYFLLLIFSPGLIQMAHFGTTESILTFVALSLAYFSLTYLRARQAGEIRKILLILSLISALGLASKVSVALFLLGPIVTFFLRKQAKRRKLGHLLFWAGTTLLLTILFSPYNLLDFSEFSRIIRYESGVARGTIPVFYTRQFINTKPFVFQLTKIFPWVLGLPLFIFLLISLFGCGWRVANLIFVKKRKFSLNSKFYILSAIFFPWFLFNSLLFAKWTRFMTPILPFLILLVVSFWQKLEGVFEKWNKQLFSILFYTFLYFSLFPGLLFLKIYLSPDIRLQASVWMNNNLPEGVTILSEAGNVVDLPLFNHKNFQVINFDFYSLEENQEQQRRLEELIVRADYILLPSRRVFANHWQLPDKFPRTARFYQRLFSGEMDFVLVKEFRVLPYWARFFLGSDLNSEETWTVFDHPTVRLFVRRR